MKTLTSVNLRHKSLGLKIPIIKNHAVLTAMITNFRSVIHSKGYDCSLLHDADVLALEDLIFYMEQTNDDREFREVLDFLSDNPPS